MLPGNDIREMLEDRESATLSPFAALSGKSRGRIRLEPRHPYRTVFQRDRDRILHSKAFRRLKRKTQVFLAPEDDHFRTRLTHTLEVAQIARTIARALRLNEDLTEAIALGHDLGHTPFGHAGEAALNEVYEPGFRHYEQSLRVVDTLESGRDGRGLNLCHEVRDGIRHHSSGKALLKGVKPEHPETLEGQVVSIADAIAYINHDIDDALRARVVRVEELPAGPIERLGETGSERIEAMVTSVIAGSEEGRIGITPEVCESMNTLRDYLYARIYPCEAIESEIDKARNLVRQLYWRLLAKPIEESLVGDPEDSLERRTVDFIAGMTDEYALRLYQRMLLPSPWKQ